MICHNLEVNGGFFLNYCELSGFAAVSINQQAKICFLDACFLILYQLAEQKNISRVKDFLKALSQNPEARKLIQEAGEPAGMVPPPLPGEWDDMQPDPSSITECRWTAKPLNPVKGEGACESQALLLSHIGFLSMPRAAGTGWSMGTGKGVGYGRKKQEWHTGSRYPPGAAVLSLRGDVGAVFPVPGRPGDPEPSGQPWHTGSRYQARPGRKLPCPEDVHRPCGYTDRPLQAGLYSQIQQLWIY
jgi:hypothetical protein